MEIKKGTNRFYITDGNQELGEITYIFQEDDVINVNHTFVDPSLRGQGMASKLLNKIIKMARKDNLKVIPTCSYAVAKLTRSDKYNDILTK
ncbi:MAG: N-acetyltransferase [Candidatus Izimaplasma sp.]|nr:N-acetyltransferase [Candidatus Izimaplasma bacterium]